MGVGEAIRERRKTKKKKVERKETDSPGLLSGHSLPRGACGQVSRPMGTVTHPRATISSKWEASVSSPFEGIRIKLVSNQGPRVCKQITRPPDLIEKAPCKGKFLVGLFCRPVRGGPILPDLTIFF